MKKWKPQNLLFYVFLLLYAASTPAQSLEVGVVMGPSNYLGDLTPSRLWTSLGETNFAAGVFARKSIQQWVALKAGFMVGKINASDANALEGRGRQRRNLSFRSPVYEFSLCTEIHLLGFWKNYSPHSFSPYLLGGLAIFHFNPQAEYQNRWVDLQPLGTEGQGLENYPEKYRLTQLAIPLGFGIKYGINKKWNAGFEFGMRKTFTDYLDDTSRQYPDLQQLADSNGHLAAELSWRTDEIDPEALPPAQGSFRGDPEDLDWYIFSGFYVTFTLEKKPPKAKKVKEVKCFKF